MLYVTIMIVALLIVACIIVVKYLFFKYDPSLYINEDAGDSQKIKDVNIVVSQIIARYNEYDCAKDEEKYVKRVSDEEIRNILNVIDNISRQ